MGKSNFNLQLGPIKLKKYLTIARIHDRVLLGHDLLFNSTGLEPADILYSEQTQKYGLVCIQLRMVNSPVKALRVESTDDELV